MRKSIYTSIALTIILIASANFSNAEVFVGINNGTGEVIECGALVNSDGKKGGYILSKHSRKGNTTKYKYQVEIKPGETRKLRGEAVDPKFVLIDCNNKRHVFKYREDGNYTITN